MRDTSTWRGLLPREFRDRLAFVSMLAGVPFLVCFEVLVVAPSYYAPTSGEFQARLGFVIFCVINFFGSLYKVMTVDASGRGSQLPSVLKPNWRYCYICHLNAPPRAYHCPICEECILKRDHHCSFAGCCIGYHNHRFYAMSVFYAWLAAVYALNFHWAYIWDSLGGLSFGTVWYIVFPQFALLFGLLSIAQFVLAGIMMGSIVSVIAASYMLGVQVVTLARGQTQHEFLINIRIYDLGIFANFQDLMGKRWAVAWLSPFIPSPLLGDGLKFPLKKEVENVKDL